MSHSARKASGSIVKLNESGKAVNYLVVHQGKPSSIYDESCNGTWLLRQDLIENRVWDDGNVNKLESSDIQPWLNGTMLGKYDANIQGAIKQVKLPYRKNGGSGGTDRSDWGKRSVLQGFPAVRSKRSDGTDNESSSIFPNDGAKLAYFLDGTGSSAKQQARCEAERQAPPTGGSAPRSPTHPACVYVFSNGDWTGRRHSYGSAPL